MMRNRFLGAALLAYLFGILSLTTGEEICEEIEVTGAEYHPLANGVYYYAPDIHCNSRPVWADEARRHYIYYLLDGYDGWMVSADSCYKWGNFKLKARTDEPLPYGESNLGWSEYLPEKAVWEKSGSFHISCLNAKSRKTVPPTMHPHPTQKEPIQGSKCAAVLCAENTMCVEYSDGDIDCVCQHGYDGNICRDKKTDFIRIPPLFAVLAIFGLIILAVAFFALVRCCRDKCVQNCGKQSISRSTSVKYKQLDEETTAHPA